MRELVQQSTSSSTELAATAEQMSKLSRTLLNSMDRFALEETYSESRRNAPRRHGHAPDHDDAAEYAEVVRN
jgi:hypothetical protein